jgi:hypothetical protein
MTDSTSAKYGIGTHSGHITKTAAAAITQKYLLGKFGSSPDTVEICAANDVPIGVITDEAAVGDPVDLALLGSPDTLLGVAAGSINAGDVLVAAASGMVRQMPTTAGTHNIIGTALTATATANQLVEFTGCVPQQRTIAEE